MEVSHVRHIFVMESNIQIQLNTTFILAAPLHAYNNDFSFFVNGEEFHTSKIISDLTRYI